MALEIDGLTPQQKALLAFQLRGRGARGGQSTSHALRRESKLPLSFAQQRLWFLAQLAPGDPSYNVAAGIHLGGKLDVVALTGALNDVVRRHEALRTRFVDEEGIPEQIIEQQVHVPIGVVDMAMVAPKHRERLLEDEVQSESSRPFDLRRAPLLRASLLRFAPAEHVMLLTMHHIVSDGWSMGVLMREVGLIYEASVRGVDSPLPPLPLQYADYAIQSRERLQGPVLDRHLNYWKRQLPPLPALELPVDRSLQDKAECAGATLSLRIDKELTEQLKRLSQGEGVTLFVILLASLVVLLVRYTGQNAITVGSPIANRTQPEIEALIGFFANTLVLRTDASGNPSFRELLRRCGSVCLEAYEHQDLPFERLVQELRPERNLGRNPLFQVSFALQNSPAVHLSMSDLHVRVLPRRSRTVRFDLEWDILPVRKELHLDLTYSASLFEQATVARMLMHYERLLQGIVANPDCRIRYLPMLEDEESHGTAERIAAPAH
jgi:condensation domain-containing protein